MRRSHGARCLRPAGAGLDSLRKGDSDMGEKALQNRLTKLQKILVSSRLDGKALKAALPEIYKQYCKASTSRRFTIA